MRIIGIDLGKVNSQLSERGGDGEEKRCVRFATDRETLREAVGSDKARILIEACTAAGWVARWLRGLGHEVVVADPNYLPMYADEKSKRRKTDKRDAAALSLALLRGNYREAHLRSEVQQRRIRLVGARSRLVRTRTKHINGVRATFAQEGLKLPMVEAEKFAKEARERLAGLQPTVRDTVELELTMLDTVNELIDQARRRIEGEAKEDPQVRLLTSAPGVGPITASAFVATIDDPSRFDNGGQAASFLGLAPGERSSGESRVLGHITKAGPGQLRSLLVQAAWSIWRSKDADSAPLREWVGRIADRRGRRIAIVALARRLTCILLAMWKKNRPFDASVLATKRSGADLPARPPGVRQRKASRPGAAA